MNLVSTFESEFGRLLTPMEKEIIDDWKAQGFTEDKIREALKQSVYNGALSLRYISKILMTWKSEEATKEVTVKDDDLPWLD